MRAPSLLTFADFRRCRAGWTTREASRREPLTWCFTESGWPGRDAKIDWKALSRRIGHADVAFTMKQYVQTDLEADRQVANTLAELIIGGSLASTARGEEDDGHHLGETA